MCWCAAARCRRQRRVRIVTGTVHQIPQRELRQLLRCLVEIQLHATERKRAGLFGPWVPGVPEAERRAALRALAALVAVFAGSDDPAVSALRRAEVDVGASDQALEAFDKLAALPRRKIISVYARLMRPRSAP